MKRIIGFENSNSRIKGLSDLKVLDYPNTIRKVRRMTNQTGSLSKGKVYEYQDQFYCVGALGDYGSGSKDASRYTDNDFKIETIIALSQMCNNGDSINLITGLPANLAERTDIIDKIKYNLIGTHRVGDGKAKKTFRIEKVNVASQPVGTLWGMLYDINGNEIVNDDIFGEKFLVIDIGFGTTDLVALSATQGIVEDSSKTLDIATSDYITKVYNAIDIEIRDSHLSQSGMTAYELDEQIRQSDTIKLTTGKFDVGSIKKDYQEEFAVSLKQRLGQFGYNLNKYHQTILTGGGASIMGNEITKVFNNDNRIKVINNPRLANVTGFFIMAKQIYGV